MLKHETALGIQLKKQSKNTAPWKRERKMKREQRKQGDKK